MSKYLRRLVTVQECADAWQVDVFTLIDRIRTLRVHPVDYIVDEYGFQVPRYNCEPLIGTLLEHDIVPIERILNL